MSTNVLERTAERVDANGKGPTLAVVPRPIQPWFTPGKLKALLFKILTLPFVFLVYYTIIAEGFRILIPSSGQKLHKLALPVISYLRQFHGLDKMDIACMLATILFIAVWYLIGINIRIFFAPKEFFLRTGWNPQHFTLFAHAIGGVMLMIDALCFYLGIVDQLGGAFGGSGFSIMGVLAAIAYTGVLVVLSFIGVNLERS
jgi:hypothetical protein